MTKKESVSTSNIFCNFFLSCAKTESQEQKKSQITKDLTVQLATSNHKIANSSLEIINVAKPKVNNDPQPKVNNGIHPKINNDIKSKASTEKNVSAPKTNQEKPKTIFLADSSDEEEEANDESEEALQDSDADEEHSLLINTYQWCVCENSSIHKNSEMCDKCKHWYHKECNLKHFTKTTTFIEDDEFNCFACNKDLTLIKKYSIALTARKHPNIVLINKLGNQRNGDRISSSENEEYSSDSDQIRKKKRTKRNQLLDSSSSSLLTNESATSINFSSSSDSETDIKSKNKSNSKKNPEEKGFKSTPRIEISDLNINIKNDNKQVGSSKSVTHQEKSKESSKLNDKERIEKVKNKLKPANQTKLMTTDDSMHKKKHRNHSESSAKVSISNNQSAPAPAPATSSSSGTKTFNSDVKKNDTVAKIKQGFLKERRGLDDLFTKPIIVNKNNTTSTSNKQSPINPLLNKSNNSSINNKTPNQQVNPTPTISKSNAQINNTSNNKIKTISSSSSASSFLPSQNRPPVQQPVDTFEACRPICKKQLIEKLRLKMDKNPKSPVLLQPELVIRVDKIEAEFYKHFSNSLKNYRTQWKSLLFNVQDTKNDTFYLKILTDQKGYMPEDLPKMSNEDMASDEIIEERKRQRQKESILLEKNSDELNLKKAAFVNSKNSEKGLPQTYDEEYRELLQRTKNQEQPNIQAQNSKTNASNQDGQDFASGTNNLNKSPHLEKTSSSSSILFQEKKLVTSPLLTSKSIDFSTPAVSFITEPRPQLSYLLDVSDILQNSSKDTTHQHSDHVFCINCKACTLQVETSSSTRYENSIILRKN